MSRKRPLTQVSPDRSVEPLAKQQRHGEAVYSLNRSGSESHSVSTDDTYQKVDSNNWAAKKVALKKLVQEGDKPLSYGIEIEIGKPTMTAEISDVSCWMMCCSI